MGLITQIVKVDVDYTMALHAYVIYTAYPFVDRVDYRSSAFWYTITRSRWPSVEILFPSKYLRIM